MPHEKLQEFFLRVNYAEEMVILALLEEEKEFVVGIGQYAIIENKVSAEVSLVVRDDYQNIGIGTELLSYLTVLAGKQGLLGFIGDALPENRTVFHLFEKMGFEIWKVREAGIYSFKVLFQGHR